MTVSTFVRTLELESIEQLNDAIPGARSSVVQLDRGAGRGHLAQMMVAGLPVSFGGFSVGVRARGVLSDDQTVIGALIRSDDRVTHWSREMLPSDVLVTPPGVEHEGRYYGGASFAAILLSADDIVSMFGHEAGLGEPGDWQQQHFNGLPGDLQQIEALLRAAIAELQRRDARITADVAAYWRRVIIEAMTVPVRRGVLSTNDGPPVSALRILRQVEDFLAQSGARPVHVSELCQVANASRRTLHRAFHDAVGIGPASFLRHKRLSDARAALRASDPAERTVEEIAIAHGFTNVGRFAAYYRALFGENPSATTRGMRWREVAAKRAFGH